MRTFEEDKRIVANRILNMISKDVENFDKKWLSITHITGKSNKDFDNYLPRKIKKSHLFILGPIQESKLFVYIPVEDMCIYDLYEPINITKEQLIDLLCIAIDHGNPIRDTKDIPINYNQTDPK